MQTVRRKLPYVIQRHLKRSFHSCSNIHFPPFSYHHLKANIAIYRPSPSFHNAYQQGTPLFNPGTHLSDLFSSAAIHLPPFFHQHLKANIALYRSPPPSNNTNNQDTPLSNSATYLTQLHLIYRNTIPTCLFPLLKCQGQQ